jgi:hypothetical protein
VCGAVLLGGCSRAPEPSSDTDALRGSVELDEALVEVGRVLPGFGGLWVDEDGVLTVRVVGADAIADPGELEVLEGRVHDVLSTVLGPDYLRQVGDASYTGEPGGSETAAPAALRLVGADYDVLQLAEWRNRAEAVLGVPRVVLTDLDERRNRVTIGVESEEAREAVERALSAQKVPLEAVIIEVVKPIHFKSLRSRHRPVVGGVQVEADIAVFGFGLCTMGFNALHEDRRGFVTNSHCTRRRGENDGTDFHQPTDPLNPFANQQKVGDEQFDPRFRTSTPCPAGQSCRTTDSAFVEYDDSDFYGSTIARTSLWTKSLDIDPLGSAFAPVAEIFFPISGVTLNKVGRTTGWTDGTLGRTCFSATVADAAGITMLCQYEVNQPSGRSGIVDNGDSGSPVFRIIAGNQVELFGLLWGGPEDNSSFVFSSMIFLHFELFPLEIEFSRPGGGQPPRPLGCEVGEKCCERDEEGNCQLCIRHNFACP